MDTAAEAWTMDPVTRPFSADVALPGSKSLTNRALVLSALATGPVTLSNVLFADDTRHMLDNLRTLGLPLEVDEADAVVRVDAPAGRRFAASDATLFCGNSGTTIRFLAALLAAVGEGTFTLDGIARMRQRPVGPLADLLNGLAGHEAVTTDAGFPPIVVRSQGLEGGTLAYEASRTLSSQYLSAGLMVAPYARHEVRVDLDGQQASWPYVRMTMRLMDVFGVTPEVELDERDEEPAAVVVPRGRYRATDYAIEPDASTASYFLAAAALHPGSRVTLAGLGSESLQGDAAFCHVLARMGCTVSQDADTTMLTGPDVLEGVDADLSDMPDCAQTLAVVALFAAGETTLRGIKTLRVKETDRVEALRVELTKLGADVTVSEADDDVSLTVTPPPRVGPASVATYDDHRMAMSFALAATRRRDVLIEHPSCVDKTFPAFFRFLQEAVAG